MSYLLETYWQTIKDIMSTVGGLFTLITAIVTLFVALRVQRNTDGLVTHLLKSKDVEIKNAGEIGEAKGEKTATAEAKKEIDQLNKDLEPKK